MDWESFGQLLLDISGPQWVLHVMVFGINLALLVFCKPITRAFNQGKDYETQSKIFRTLNVLFMVLHIADLFVMHLAPAYQSVFFNLGLTLASLYASIFLFSFGSYLSRKKFGREKRDSKGIYYIDTYSSRLIDVILLAILLFFLLYILIKIWGLDSWLETTGIFGLVVAFLALTNGIWAPDLYYGLVILNSKVLDDSDVIQVFDEQHLYIINKVNFLHTLLIDIQNNHQTLIRNSSLINQRIDNLTKKASSEGLRDKLVYKIGYPNLIKEHKDGQARIEALHVFQRTVSHMFEAAFSQLTVNEHPHLNTNVPFEVAMTATGDFALEYTLYFYLKPLPPTKVSRTVRDYLYGTKFKINETVYQQSIEHGIDLSTPVLLDRVEI